jgi:hypothetical protein
MPPTPAPDRIKPYTIFATFEVDATGRVLEFKFNESRDGGYNRRVRAMLSEIRFRPATTLDGVPVRASVTLEFNVF